MKNIALFMKNPFKTSNLYEVELKKNYISEYYKKSNK